jgi:hypothetical protein
MSIAVVDANVVNPLAEDDIVADKITANSKPINPWGK